MATSNLANSRTLANGGSGIEPPRIGFLVNPLAGLGGRVGLKGSDGADTVAAALALGAQPAASDRAALALRELAGSGIAILTAGGAMGETACQRAGIHHHVAFAPAGPETSANDTIEAARAFLKAEAKLVLFAGGDGTARDILSAVGRDMTMVGIPAGVKMYSGVFALSPVHAGLLARTHLAQGADAPTDEREILDIDEASLRQDRPATRLYGYGLVPRDPTIQVAKASAIGNDDVAALCRAAAADLEPGCVHIVGPGSTMQRLLAEAELEGSLLGVDLVANGKLLAKDVGEADILACLDQWPARIHVGVIGGTGCLFGRGNQQISAKVLQRVGRERIAILAPPSKLALLGPAGFFVDTGDAEVDRMLGGYIKVRTAPRREMVMRVRG
ncbi:ATP-NAD kinase family protein [Mesorhizobium sp. YC-39]|uniref:ATP-NAD kinase family protein n=1 Tax=unclassified Mesorhizobium TaxID=325217 RepID=UPI0021E8F17F|nr:MULTISPECIES: ATP-NAD kinase family protein [unclassified Mesorhizobium]MCV3206572.1 ATP-NAD kinase family protein [Mesorhizobium sp. YC-2]MCV3227028.1 ATP-NAD kinase family protein [Mesorhizobium sp. YC-39]